MLKVKVKGSKKIKDYKLTLLNQSSSNKCVFRAAQESLVDKCLTLDELKNLVLHTYMVDLTTNMQVLNLNFKTTNGNYFFGSSVSLTYSNLTITRVAYSSYSSSYATRLALKMLICEVLEDSKLWLSLIQHTTHMRQYEANNTIIEVLLRKFSGRRKSELLHFTNVVKSELI